MCDKNSVLLFQTDQELRKGKFEKIYKAIFMRPDG